jgi:hypothetical protein
MIITPVIDRLVPYEFKRLVDEGFIKLDIFGNPVGDFYKLNNIYGSNILIGKF